MQTIVATAFGSPDVLEIRDMAAPEPQPGQVLVDVDAIDVLDLDTKLRAGAGGDWFPYRPPYTPGGGVAGRVTTVGDGVDPSLIGHRVLARTVDAPIGGCAEQAVAATDTIIHIPDALDAVTAVALIHDGLTAFALLDALPVTVDDRVLLLGPAGGAASLLVQLTADAGATVVGAARGQRKLTAVRDLGANATVDCSAPGWVDTARRGLGDGATLVFDGVGGELGRAALEHLTAKGGRFSAHGAAGGGFAVGEDRDDIHDRLGITVTGIEGRGPLTSPAGPLRVAVAFTAGAPPGPMRGLTQR